MIVTDKVRAVRKAAQEERVKRKTEEGYPEFYAQQPAQLELARKADTLRLAKVDLGECMENLQIAEITGDHLVQAQEKVAIARRVVQRLEAELRTNNPIALSAAGG